MSLHPRKQVAVCPPGAKPLALQQPLPGGCLSARATRWVIIAPYWVSYPEMVALAGRPAR